MEALFTATIIINGQPQEFAVTFKDEKYKFVNTDGNAPAFQFRRAEDNWHLEGDLAPIARDQAVSALDHYLMSQH